MKRILTTLLFLFCLNIPMLAIASEQPVQETPPAEEYSWIPSQFVMSEAQLSNNQIQIFDVAKGKVVKSINNAPQFQATATGWLSKIKQLAPEVQPDMNATYIVRVPLDPALQLKVGNVNLTVKEIFTFYYDDPSKEPLLLVFDDEKKPYFFHIQEDLTPFINSLSIPN